MKRFTPASGEFSAADQDFKADFEAAEAGKPNAPEAEAEGGLGLMTPAKAAATTAEFTKAFEETPSAPTGADTPAVDEFDQAGIDGEAAMEEAKAKADEAAAQYDQKLSFKQAFKKAREDGLSVFTWPEGSTNPKDRYKTDMAGSKPAEPKGLMDPAPAKSADVATPLGMSKKSGSIVDGVSDGITDAGEMLSTKSRKPEPQPEPQPEPKRKMSAFDVKPLAAADDAPSIYGRGGMKKPTPEETERNIKRVGSVA